MLNCSYFLTERFRFGMIIFFGVVAVYSQRLFFGINLICMEEQNKNLTYLRDSKSIGRIQGVFYIGYAISQIPSSLIFINYGTRYPMLVALLTLALINLIMPVMVQFGYWAILTYRFFVGLLTATFLPGFYEMMPNWTPISELNIMLILLGSGINFASILAPLVASWVCEAGWMYNYYFFGCIGLINSALWCIGAYDKPSDHPRIRKEELNYLNVTVAHVNSSKENNRSLFKIPVLKLIKCVPLWTFFFTLIAFDWLMFLLQTNVSFYFKMLTFDIKDNARITSMMTTALVIGQFLLTFICNLLISRKITSRTNARKIMNFIGCFVPITCLLTLYFVTKSTSFFTILSILCFLHFFLTGIFMGSFVAPVENVPTYSSFAFSVINSLSSVIGYFSAEVYGKLTQEDEEHGWHLCFLITAGIFTFAMLFHLIFGSSNLASWEQKTNENNEIPIEYNDEVFKGEAKKA